MASKRRRPSNEFIIELAGPPHRLPNADARGAERADSRWREMEVRMGKYADFRFRRTSHYRILPLERIQPEHADRLGKCLLHSERNVLRLAGARHSSFCCTSDDDFTWPAFYAGDYCRCLSRTARGQFLAWSGLDADRAGFVAHRVSASLGSEGILRHESCDEYRRRDADDRSSTSANRAGRYLIWSSHVDSIFCLACRNSSSITGGIPGPAYFRIPSARNYRF